MRMDAVRQHKVANGQLITDQNRALSGPTAKFLIDTLNRRTK